LGNAILEAIKTAFIQNAPRVLYSILILTIGFLISRLLKRWLNAILSHSRIRDDILLKNFFLRSVTFSILALTFLSALSQIGLDVQTFIAGLGVTGLIIGFALRDTLSNFAAGLLLLTYRPFRAGELIEVEGSEGSVEELTIVNIQMTTTDGVRVILPNSKVWGAKITNYSQSKRRRIEATISVREDDIEVSIEAVLSRLLKDEKVLKVPAPAANVSSLKNGVAALTISLWASPKDFATLSAESNREVIQALRENEIPIL
jgi:small conductance mechanosensitive channel